MQVGREERLGNGDSGGGYESHLQGFVGGDMRGNIIRHTEYRCEIVCLKVDYKLRMHPMEALFLRLAGNNGGHPARRKSIGKCKKK